AHDIVLSLGAACFSVETCVNNAAVRLACSYRNIVALFKNNNIGVESGQFSCNARSDYTTSNDNYVFHLTSYNKKKRQTAEKYTEQNVLPLTSAYCLTLHFSLDNLAFYLIAN